MTHWLRSPILPGIEVNDDLSNICNRGGELCQYWKVEEIKEGQRLRSIGMVLGLYILMYTCMYRHSLPPKTLIKPSFCYT